MYHSALPSSDIDQLVKRYVTVLSVRYREVTNKKTSVSSYVPVYEVLPTPNISIQMSLLSSELQEIGFVGLLRDGVRKNADDTCHYLLIVPFQESTDSTNFWIHLMLYIATFMSVLLAGWFIADQIHEYQPNEPIFIGALLYAISLMTILTIHELGHMTAARKHGTKTSLPYFIPMPFFPLGTLGAVITQKAPLKNRNVLFDVGLSGPYAGLVVAILFAIIGTLTSPVVPKESVDPHLLEKEYGLIFGSFLFDLLATTTLSLFVDVPPDHIVILSPLGLASYFGILVTGLNLLPIGQLDGGHVSRSVLNSKNHRTLTFLVALFMVIIGFWLMALIILVLFLRSGHPGPLDDVDPLSRKRKAIGFLSIGVAILCMPWPPDIYVTILKSLGLW